MQDECERLLGARQGHVVDAKPAVDLRLPAATFGRPQDGIGFRRVDAGMFQQPVRGFARERRQEVRVRAAGQPLALVERDDDIVETQPFRAVHRQNAHLRRVREVAALLVGDEGKEVRQAHRGIPNGFEFDRALEEILEARFGERIVPGAGNRLEGFAHSTERPHHSQAREVRQKRRGKGGRIGQSVRIKRPRERRTAYLGVGEGVVRVFRQLEERGEGAQHGRIENGRVALEDDMIAQAVFPAEGILLEIGEQGRAHRVLPDEYGR